MSCNCGTMENNNWRNFQRNNAPRGTRGYYRGHPRRENERDGSMRFGALPPPHSSSGNRQNNLHRYYQNPGPNYGYGKREENYTKYFKTKSFPQYGSSPYSRNQQYKQDYWQRYSQSTNSLEFRPTVLVSIPKQLTPLEQKIDRLITAVKSQDGVIGLLVLLQTKLDNPTIILQNAVQSLRNGVLTVIAQESSQIFQLFVNGEKMVEGEFPNKQVAKNALCETLFEELKKKCFYIIKKKNYEEVSTEDITQAKKEVLPSSTMEGSKAHLMMLKMGWGGKGLGSKEQGDQKTVAETLTQNVTKEGLGNKNIMNEIHGILEDFAGSIKVTTLAFDSAFTKEERAHIHSIASKFNLKTKSEGKDENRRITISKKIARWDLVRELLLVNCENDSYKLIIPSDFEDMWHDK